MYIPGIIRNFLKWKIDKKILLKKLLAKKLLVKFQKWTI